MISQPYQPLHKFTSKTYWEISFRLREHSCWTRIYYLQGKHRGAGDKLTFISKCAALTVNHPTRDSLNRTLSTKAKQSNFHIGARDFQNCSSDSWKNHHSKLDPAVKLSQRPQFSALWRIKKNFPLCSLFFTFIVQLKSLRFCKAIQRNHDHAQDKSNVLKTKKANPYRYEIDNCHVKHGTAGLILKSFRWWISLLRLHSYEISHWKNTFWAILRSAKMGWTPWLLRTEFLINMINEKLWFGA